MADQPGIPAGAAGLAVGRGLRIAVATVAVQNSPGTTIRMRRRSVGPIADQGTICQFLDG